LTGTNIQNDEKDPTLIRVQKTSIVQQTKIEFDSLEVYSLVYSFLKENQLNDTANTLLKELNVCAFSCLIFHLGKQN
jgi:hypothetical protein